MDLFWFFPLLCLVFMIGMMFMMLRHGGCMSMSRGPRTGRGGERETPREILDRRFASGEIAQDQYEALKRALQSSGRMT
jgi:putative membrane protein